MKKITVIVLLAVLASCAGKEPPFDAVAKFKEAETSLKKEDFEKARKAYQEIQEKSPDRSYDADIMLRIADTYFGEEKYDEARVEYESFLNFHPVNRNAPYAQYQVAMCSYRQLPTIDRDPSITRTALKEFRKLIEKYPKSGYEKMAETAIAVCLNRLAEYEFYVGRFYYKKDSYQAALGRFEKLLRDYPGSSVEKDALLQSGRSHLELGNAQEARAVFDALVQKYPSLKEKTAVFRDRLKQ